MTRYFAVPFLVALLWVVSVRWVATPFQEERAPIKTSPVEPTAEEAFPVTREILLVLSPRPETPAAASAPVAPPPSPSIIAAPPPPPARVEIVERAVSVPETTVVYAPTLVYCPVEIVSPLPAPEPSRTEIVEIVVVCPLHRRPCSCDRLMTATPTPWPRAGNFMKPSLSSFLPPAKMPPPSVTRSQ